MISLVTLATCLTTTNFILIACLTTVINQSNPDCNSAPSTTDEAFSNSSLDVQLLNSTAVVVFLDHGWIQADWNFYEEKFITLTNRIAATGSYSDLILSPNYIAYDPYFSISIIFLEMMTRLNKNRSRKLLPKINVWLHLRSKQLHELHDEVLTIPFLTSKRLASTITGLLIESNVLHARKEWSWKGLQLYKKAVQSIKPDLRLAMLLDRYQCSLLPLHIPKEVIMENFDLIYYHDYDRRGLEEISYNLAKTQTDADVGNMDFNQRETIYMSRIAYEDCNMWLLTNIINSKLRVIQGIFHGMESKDYLKFTEIQILCKLQIK